MAGKAKQEELLGKRIKELRKKKGLTQEELGARAGISYKYLGSIERGLENPSFRHLAKIARALGVELSELFQFQHLEPSRERLIKEINKMLTKMSDSQLQLTYRLLKDILS